MAGGDTSLTSRLAQELRILGHQVRVSPVATDSLMEGVDVVHGVNIDRSVLGATEQFAAAARRRGVPLVLTPLWWPLGEFVAAMTLRERAAFELKGFPAARLARERALTALRTTTARQQRVIASASMVCPSGAAEEQALIEHFAKVRTSVVMYGTDETPPTSTARREGVLCVARLDPRKNQLRLIQALSAEPDLELTLVGTDRVFPAYAAACRRAATENVKFAGYLPRAEVSALLARARVHVLPSFFELPGLTSLDAAARGAAVVASVGGTPRDYFGAHARYATPSVESIRSTVLAAYGEGPESGLASTVATQFTWQRTASAYAAVYAGALSS